MGQDNVVTFDLCAQVFGSESVFFAEIQIKGRFFDNAVYIRFALGSGIEIEEAAVVHQADVIGFVILFPHPVLRGEFAIAVVFCCDIVALVIAVMDAGNIVATAHLYWGDVRVLQNVRSFVIDGVEGDSAHIFLVLGSWSACPKWIWPRSIVAARMEFHDGAVKV